MMHRKHSAIFLFFLIGITFTAFAQDDFYHPELEWRSIETDHFYVHYHKGTERTARVIAKIAEEIYEPVTSLYNHKPEGKVSFVVKDYDDYSNGAAYFLDNKIEIWASSLDFDLRGTHNWLRNVITHEFTHIVQIQTSLKFGRRIPAFYLQWLGYESERRPDVLYGFPNIIASYPISGFVVPSWFAEGVAQYNRKELGYESWDAHRDMILRMYALDGNMLTWNEMSVFGKTSLGNESSYNAGFAFVRYIAQLYGEEKLVEISRNLSALTAVTIDGAIEKAIGKNGKQLYDEWKEYLQKDYANRIADIKDNIAGGNIIANVGFGNFYPAFSPDGKSLAYVSNKEADYFGLSSLYRYDVATKTEKQLQSGVRSNISWSPDGNIIYYSKSSRSNNHWSNFFDVYSYNIEQDDEKRLTHGIRANAPAVSPDGASIAYVASEDGTINLFVINSDGTNIRQLTQYEHGEQVYNPKWSPDGKHIIFDYSIKDGRDVAMISAEGGEVQYLLATVDDERNAVFTSDGSSIVFSSDKTGIFNIYQMNLSTKETKQLTNVLGGAFMPTVNASGQLAFASYKSGGYKIALMDNSVPLEHTPVYARNKEHEVPSVVKLASADTDPQTRQFDWQVLRSYDDSKLPSHTDTTYRNVATSLTFVPFIRVDNYNPKNKGIDVIKPGVYLYSFDVLDKYGFFAGAAMNLKAERDLFFTFNYNGKVPGLFQLGLEPSVSFEVFNVTRKADAAISPEGFNDPSNPPYINIPVEVTYSLLEFDIALKQKIFTEALELETRFSHSRYTANVESFIFSDPSSGTGFLNPAFSNLYFIGNDLSATLRLEAISPSRTMEINPRGRKIKFRYDYEFGKFNPESEYEISNGLLIPKYQQPRFHRVDLNWREYLPLPGWKHTLSVQLRGGSVLGPPVDDFFDFYIGGFAGMKGYPFYSLGGNEYAMANITYRFPLFEHIDLRVLQLYFDKLYAAVYGDAGVAWTGGGMTNQQFRRDIGAELRLEAFSYYAFPTRIFFNATYGLDKFNRYVNTTNSLVTYGHEWNFHFGILFGFDLD